MQGEEQVDVNEIQMEFQNDQITYFNQEEEGEVIKNDEQADLISDQPQISRKKQLKNEKKKEAKQNAKLKAL